MNGRTAVFREILRRPKLEPLYEIHAFKILGVSRNLRSASVAQLLQRSGSDQVTEIKFRDN